MPLVQLCRKLTHYDPVLGCGNVAEALTFSAPELDDMGLDVAPLLRLKLLREVDVGVRVEFARGNFRQLAGKLNKKYNKSK